MSVDERLLSEPSIRRALQHIEQGCQCSVLQATDLIRHINALTDALAASQARADALALVLAEMRAAALGITNHLHHGECDSMQYLDQPDCACGLKAKMARLLAADPDARGTALLEAAEGMAEAFESRRLEPYGNFIARIRAAVDRWRALLGPGGRGAGE